MALKHNQMLVISTNHVLTSVNYRQRSASILVVLGFPDATSSLTVVTPYLSFQVYRSAIQHLLGQIPCTLTPTNMTKPDSYITTIIHLLS